MTSQDVPVLVKLKKKKEREKREKVPPEGPKSFFFCCTTVYYRQQTFHQKVSRLFITSSCKIVFRSSTYHVNSLDLFHKMLLKVCNNFIKLPTFISFCIYLYYHDLFFSPILLLCSILWKFNISL